MRGDIFLARHAAWGPVEHSSSDEEDELDLEQPFLYHSHRSIAEQSWNSTLSQPHELLLETIHEGEEGEEEDSDTSSSSCCHRHHHHHGLGSTSHRDCCGGRSRHSTRGWEPSSSMLDGYRVAGYWEVPWDSPVVSVFDWNSGGVQHPAGKARGTCKSYATLTKLMLGAGIMAIPSTFSRLGLLGGFIAVLLVAAVTIFSLKALARASERTGCSSYATLASRELGSRAGMVVRGCMVVCCGGLLLIYLTVVVDMLVGSDNLPGLVDDLMPPAVRPGALHAPAGPGSNSTTTSTSGGGGAGIGDSRVEHGPPDWLFSRTLWVTLIAWGLLAPLCSVQQLRQLPLAGSVAPTAALCLISITTLLATVAWASGQAAEIRWLPDFSFVSGHGHVYNHGLPRLVAALTQLACAAAQTLGALPAILGAFTCHFGVHHIMGGMAQYTTGRMNRVIDASTASASAAYVVLGAAGYVLYGGRTSADVLADFEVEDLTPLVGYGVAQVLTVCVKAMYAGALLLAFPFLHWQTTSELLCMLRPGPASHGTPLTKQGQAVVSYGVLALLWAAALIGASVWQVATLVGSTTGVLLCWILPASLALRNEAACPSSGGCCRAAAYLILGAGAAISLAGCASVLAGLGLGEQ